MKIRRMRWLLATLAILALGSAWWLWQRPAPHVITADDASINVALVNPEIIARGHYLATAGDCVSCHTAQGGEPYAGGRMLPTPFGTIPAPNITPDPDTGIGRWHFEDFWRAMHDGIGRDGERLYPAFSYTSFTKVTRADALAIFAYLRSLQPVHQPNAPLQLRFPYNMRSVLAVWRAMYFTPGVYVADAAQSPSWNRGAYLVLGLGHCNECHAARDAWGGIDTHATLSGGQIPEQDWYAPDLSTRANGGLQAWSRQDLVGLLKTGQSSKGTAVGPMADVVAGSTQHLSDDDLNAMADYLASLPARNAPASVPPGVDSDALAAHGKDLYTDRCENCHGKQGEGVPGVYPPLDGNASVVEPTGINAIRVVLLGGFAPVTAGNPRPYSMPPYAQQLSDADVAAVVTYIRRAWSNHASAVQERDVERHRHTPID